jgi:hypothetical protein
VAQHVVYERDGTAEAVRIMLRPLAATTIRSPTLPRLLGADRRAAPARDLYLIDADVRRVLALDAIEASWLEQLWSNGMAATTRSTAVSTRCVISRARAGATHSFLEPNLSGIGGFIMGRSSAARDARRRRRHAPPRSALLLELPRDQRDLFHAGPHRARRRPEGAAPRFIEPKYERSGLTSNVLATYIEDKYRVAVVPSTRANSLRRRRGFGRRPRDRPRLSRLRRPI